MRSLLSPAARYGIEVSLAAGQTQILKLLSGWPMQGTKIIQAACGAEHSVALSEDGQVCPMLAILSPPAPLFAPLGVVRLQE